MRTQSVDTKLPGWKKSGKTADDVAAAWQTPARYTGYAKPTPARVKADAQVAFDESK